MGIFSRNLILGEEKHPEETINLSLRNTLRSFYSLQEETGLKPELGWVKVGQNTQDYSDKHVLRSLFKLSLCQDLEDGPELGLGVEGLGVGSGGQWISLSFFPLWPNWINLLFCFPLFI